MNDAVHNQKRTRGRNNQQYMFANSAPRRKVSNPSFHKNTLENQITSEKKIGIYKPKMLYLIIVLKNSVNYNVSNINFIFNKKNNNTTINIDNIFS